MTEHGRNLLTVKQFAEKHKAFPVGGLRAAIFNAEKNGLKECILRVGRKVLLDEDAFFRWIEQQNR